MSDNDGCLALIIVLVVIFAVSFVIGLIMTNLIIWVGSGLFNYDLSDKFWYVFWGYYILQSIFGQKVVSKSNS